MFTRAYAHLDTEALHAAYLHGQIENGGLLLWVRTWDARDEERALEIVARHAADSVHSHPIPSEKIRAAAL